MMSVFGLERVTVLKVGLVAALLAACLLALVGSAKPIGATFPGANGKIAFGTNRDGNNEIYTMDADGSNQINLTNNAAEDHSPSWSPDGTKIAFMRVLDGNPEIYTMDADGSNQTRLTNNAALDQSPSWSPDGTKIAFATARGGSSQEIYVMNADGSNQTELTNNSGTYNDFAPVFSPDGTKIAFVTTRDINLEIYVMNADGSNQTRLTNTATREESPSWSPDGTKIAFQSFREASGDDIYVMNADGSNQTNLTNNATFDHSPSWSPDGTKIAFMSELDPLTSVIYTMNAEGSNQTRLTNGSDCCPSWQRQPIPVVYSFSGFYQPVDNLPTLNKTKPGKTIPVRFSLGGDRGLKIFESGYPRSEAITCETGAQVDDIEQTELGKNGLTYDPVSDRYTYHWATSSAWSGCRQFVMKLKDGSIQRANFTFK